MSLVDDNCGVLTTIVNILLMGIFACILRIIFVCWSSLYVYNKCWKWTQFASMTTWTEMTGRDASRVGSIARPHAWMNGVDVIVHRDHRTRLRGEPLHIYW